MNYYPLTYTIFTVAMALVVISITLPRIYRLKHVKNGLILLRNLLLVSGLMMWTLTFSALIILLSRFVVPSTWYRVTVDALLMIFGTALLVSATVKFAIYSLQYSVENIERHEDIDRVNRKKYGKGE